MLSFWLHTLANKSLNTIFEIPIKFHLHPKILILLKLYLYVKYRLYMK